MTFGIKKQKKKKKEPKKVPSDIIGRQKDGGTDRRTDTPKEEIQAFPGKWA